jgi:uncharacterized phage-associated protein
MTLRFNEKKATQAAARLLKRRGQGNMMSYTKLIKLLYFADREALLRWGSPITTDAYFAMQRGPVLSRVHDLVTEGASPTEAHFWEEHIQQCGDHEVRLVNDPSNGELSEIEEEMLDEIFARYGNLSRWDIVEEAHKLPEWKDKHKQGTAIPIDISDILRAGQKTPRDIEAISKELEATEHVHCLFASL